jgi:hypothetical protein
MGTINPNPDHMTYDIMVMYEVARSAIKRGIYWPDEWLSSSEGSLCKAELVIYVVC